MVPTVVDGLFICMLVPFLLKMFNWFDNSISREKALRDPEQNRGRDRV